MKKDYMKKDEQSEPSNDNHKIEENLPVKSTHKKLLVIIGIVVITVISILMATLLLWPKNNKPKDVSTIETNSVESVQSSTTTSAPKLIIGNVDAKVTIVEYGDFKCPLCGRFFRETEPQIIKDYINSGKANIEFRPLPIIAKDSTVAALGAYCSAEQNKFEQYHNAVFDYIYTNHYSKSLKDENADIFTLEKLTEIATSQGIEAVAFKNCMTSNKYSSAIEASENTAKSDGANATPTIIIGKQKIVGAQPFAIYKPFIESQLR